MRTNAKRSRTKKARNFGGEAALVRAMDCIVQTAGDPGTTDDELAALGWTACGGAACAHHVHPRQRGGVGEGRFGLFPACARHGDEAGEASPTKGPSSKRIRFEERYGVNVPRIADAIALAHEPPLGIRGLAARWSATNGGCDPLAGSAYEPCACFETEPLVGYDLAALMGWTRRRMETELSSCREQGCDRSQDWNAMIGAVQTDIGWEYHAGNGPSFETAVALCEQAGWPS